MLSHLHEPHTRTSPPKIPVPSSLLKKHLEEHLSWKEEMAQGRETAFTSTWISNIF